jgi:hypothetical protein
MTKEFAGMIIGKKWRQYRDEYGIEFKDPWEPLIESAKSLIPEQYFKVPPWTEEHFHDWVMAEKGAITWGCGSCGKAGLVDSRVYTPDGPVRLGDLRVGDAVFGADGRPTRVVGIPFEGDCEVYRVEFSDGSFYDCSPEHLWTVQNNRTQPRQKPRTVDTRELARLCTQVTRYFTPVCAPVEFFLPGERVIDPYVLGALLGDGSFGGRRGSSVLRFTNIDTDVLHEVSSRLPSGYRLVDLDSRDHYITHGSKARNVYIQALKAMGLWACGSSDKFIPDIYLYDSIQARWDLLAGLLDTDGFAGKSGEVVFSTSSPRLASGVRELAESLGGVAWQRSRRTGYRNGDGHHVECLPAYEVRMRFHDYTKIFKSRRKLARVCVPRRYKLRRYVKSVKPLGYTRRMRCITVDRPDGLFLVNNFIVTHNSNDYGLLMLLDWMTDPYDTAIRLGSTDKQSLKSRSWNAIVTYLAALKRNTKGLIVPGKHSKAGYAILNDDSDDSPESIGEKAGIVGVAVNDSEDSGKLQGAHAKYVRLVIDELATITHHENIKKAMSNLRIGAVDFRFYALANPASWEDESCQYCIPKGGIQSVNPDTGLWTSTRGYLVRHHDGLKCITVTNPETVKEYPFLITQEVVDANLADCDGNMDAPLMWQMVRGFPSASGVGAPPVLDPKIANAEHVGDPCPPGSVVGTAAGLDPAWSEGGDGAVYQRVVVRDIGGKLILDFTGGQRKLHVKASDKRTVTEQLCDQVRAVVNEKYSGVPTAELTATAVDSSGNQNLADNLDIFIGRGAASCIHVNNSSRASPRPIRHVAGVVEQNSETHIERCCDRYQDRGTESWCVLAEFCRAGMVRGLPPEAVRALTTRRFAFRKNTTVVKQPLQLESKDEFKIRFKKSPDEADACALAALAVKEALGVLPFSWLAPASTPLGSGAAPDVTRRFFAPVAGSYRIEQKPAATYGTPGEVPLW